MKRTISVAVVLCLLMTSLAIVPEDIVGTAKAEEPMESGDTIGFRLYCEFPEDEVGDQVGAQTATYRISVLNYIHVTEAYTVSLSIENPNTTHWDAALSHSTIIFEPDAKPYDHKEVTLTVTAKSDPPPEENTWVEINVTGTATGMMPSNVSTWTTMNSYEPLLTVEQGAQRVVPGHHVDYIINVTNNGKKPTP